VNSGVVQMLDPARLARPAIPAPTSIEAILVDRREFPVSPALELPPHPRDLEIDYTSPGFLIPQKVRFRYRLDPADREWHDAGNLRKAFYTNLAPGKYRFRVTASNSDGVWNEDAATLAFSVAPAFYQTRWFQALCAALAAALLWAAYQARTRHLRRESRKLRDEIETMERLHRLEADLAHINRVSMLGELAASIAHEVNQPLSGVVSNGGACVRWLDGDVPDLEEARAAARRIVRDGKRAGEIIARVRALTRRKEVPRESLDLNESIREVLALVGDQMKQHEVVLRTDLADDAFPVLGDQVQLQQVVLNLILNAIDAMSMVRDRPRGLVLTSRNLDADQVQVTVEDSGIGLDPKTVPVIFDSFVTTKAGGMGMGLSICRSILQAHGGRLWVAPKDGPGAVFCFALPRDVHATAAAAVTGVS
jgi:signal transduction histidine kinase